MGWAIVVAAWGCGSDVVDARSTGGSTGSSRREAGADPIMSDGGIVDSDAAAGDQNQGPQYICPTPGSAFVLDHGSSGAGPTVKPWLPERWCAQPSDCAEGESCFLVTPERGLCSSPTGVTCEQLDTASGGAGGAAAGDSGAVDYCPSGGECYYDKPDGVLSIQDYYWSNGSPMCTENGCSEHADCSDGMICVPGWVGPNSSNTCMVPGCRSDADCTDAPCKKCVFLMVIGWLGHATPHVTWPGSFCL